MAVSYISQSESHTGTTGNTGSPNPFTWSHNGGVGSTWALVFVFTIASATQCTGVTYGGAAMTAVPYVGFDSDTEPGGVQAFFLDNIATGTQTVSVSRSGTSIMYAVCFSGMAAGATEIGPNVYTRGGSAANTNASTTGTGTGAMGLISVDDGSPGTDSLRFMGAYYGGAAPLAAGTGSTQGPIIDLGAYGCATYRETTAGQGARNVGSATGTDDRGVIALSIREVPVDNRDYSAVLTGGGVYTNSASTQRSQTATATGGGVFTLDYARSAKNADFSATATGGGVVTTVRATSRSSFSVLTGGGVLTSARVKGALSVSSSTGGGVLTTSRTTARNVGATATGGGTITTVRVKAAAHSAAASGGGVLTVAATKGSVTTIANTGGGVVLVATTKSARSSPPATGAGVATIDASRQALTSVLATGGGVVTVDYFIPGASPGTSAVITGGGSVTIDTRGDHANVIVATGGGIATIDAESWQPQTYAISGYTRDASGQPVAHVNIDVFRTSDNAFLGSTMSDGLGHYAILVTEDTDYFLVAYTDQRVGVSARNVRGA